MKKILILLWAMMVCAGVAWSAVVHTVQRGESLETIARDYNTSVQSIVNANPGCENLFYVGLKLTIPDMAEGTERVPEASARPVASAVGAASVSAGVTSDQPAISGTGDTAEATANDFSNLFAMYSAPFDAFDKGFYGLGWVSYYEGGFGGTFSVHGNWGLMDPGNFMAQFGPVYGYPVHPNIMLGAQLKGFVMSYDDFDGDMKVGGGMYLTPNINFRAKHLVVSVGYNIGWGKTIGEVKFDHHFQASIGFNI